ncbi:MAG: hypothetical protein HKL96_07335, partial [Phycisphaerales bacterium]|nr:hypothetical protein [Phycisphaerales bacterium]
MKRFNRCFGVFAVCLMAMSGYAAAAPIATVAQTSQQVIPDLRRIDQLVGELSSTSTSSAAEEELRALPPGDLPGLDHEMQNPHLPSQVRKVVLGVIERLKQRAITSARRQRRYQWYLTQTLDVYRKIGDHNLKWDADAQKALIFFSKSQSRPAFDYRNAWITAGLTRLRLHTVYEAIKAINKGCHDPLITMIADCNPFWKEGQRLWPSHRNVLPDQNALLQSKYPAAIKLEFITAIALRVQSLGGWQAAEALAERNLDLLSATVRQPDVPVSFFASQFQCYLGLLAGQPDQRHIWQKVHDEVFKAIQVQHPSRRLQYVYLLLKGSWLYSWGYRARGTGFASQVSSNGWNLLGSRCRAARTTLRKAYSLFPMQPEVPILMMQVNLALGHPKRIVKWFQSAMKADPNNHLACDQMLWSLHRRWYGSAAAMAAFGQWCINYGHWKSRIPFIALHAMFTIEADMRYPPVWSWGPNITFMLIGHSFWNQPQVWRTVYSVFHGYYQRDTKSFYHLGLYTFICMWTDHWKEIASRLGYYFNHAEDPQVEKVVDRYYFGPIQPPGYFPFATCVGKDAIPWYFSLTKYSLARIYDEAKVRLAQPETAEPWKIYHAHCKAKAMKWAAGVTIHVCPALGNQTTPWAKYARRAMHEEQLVLARPDSYQGNERDLMLDDARSAIKSGCKDPWLMYLKAHNTMAIEGLNTSDVSVEIAAAQQVAAGAYPLCDKFMAGAGAAWVAESSPSSHDRKLAGALLAEARRLLPQFARSQNIPLSIRCKECRILWRATALQIKSWPATNNNLLPLLPHGHAPAMITVLMRAWGEKHLALTCMHGSGLAAIHQMSRTAAAQFLYNMDKSLLDYHLAWKLDPNCAAAAEGALSAQLWMNTRTHKFWLIWPFNSTWFIRAFNANPGNIKVCRIGENFEAMCAPPYNGRGFDHDDCYLAQFLRDPMFFRKPSSRMVMVLLYGCQAVLDNP